MGVEHDDLPGSVLSIECRSNGKPLKLKASSDDLELCFRNINLVIYKGGWIGNRDT